MTTLCAGCQREAIAHFTVVSTNNMEFDHANEYMRAGTVTDKDTQSFYVIFPVGDKPCLTQAVNQAIAIRSDGVALIDATVYKEALGFPLICFENSFVVEGTLLIEPTLPLEESFTDLEKHAADVAIEE